MLQASQNRVVKIAIQVGKTNLLRHVAGFNLGVLMRALHGYGTPREAADARAAFIFVLQTELRCWFSA